MLLCIKSLTLFANKSHMAVSSTLVGWLTRTSEPLRRLCTVMGSTFADYFHSVDNFGGCLSRSNYFDLYLGEFWWRRILKLMQFEDFQRVQTDALVNR